MKYIIGVDGGGTSTKAAAYNLSGQLLFEKQTGFSNLLNGVEEGLKNIRTALEAIFQTLEQKNCQLIVLGIAGVDSGDFKEVIADELRKYKVDTVVLNDAWMAHYALLEGADGCLVISGTGSIMIGKHNEQKDRVGGWGNILGDGGSGYDIAKQLIKSTLQAQDEGRPYTKLEKKLLKEKEFSSPFELVKFTYSASKDQVANLSMLIVDEANSGNQDASKLFENAGLDLAKQTAMLIEKLKMTEQPNVAVTGSVLINNDWVYETFKQKLLHQYPTTQFIRKDQSNTIGGYYYYLNMK